MTNLLLISKNQALAELISSENKYNLEWFNNDLVASPDFEKADVVIYDGFSYGMKPIELEMFDNIPLIILDAYSESLFVSSLISQGRRAYLLIDDFLEELPEAINSVIEGESFITRHVPDLA